MADMVTPRKFQAAVKAGFDRMKSYRKARAMFIKEAVGQYYRQEFGLTGEQPINLLFSAFRTIIPTIVNQNPSNDVATNKLAYKEYAELLGLGLDDCQKHMNIQELYKGATASAFFAFAVAKTSIAVSGESIPVDGSNVDLGRLYSDLVDLDDFVFDAVCTSLKSSAFLGHRARVSRQSLLDSDLYDKELVRKLPSAGLASKGGEKAISELTKLNASTNESDLVDMVNVVECWIPDANALVVIPDPNETTFDDYIAVMDYYGPDDGPYSFLYFTPPIDGNPLPVSPASVIFDLHRASNDVFKKILEQGLNQKDLLLYNPSNADTAQDIVDSKNGATISTSNPEGVKSISVGGQNKENSLMLGQLQNWFNYMAQNPDQMAGIQSNAKTATQANILNGNAAVGVEDSRACLYNFAADISRKQLWYLHTDPLIHLPLAKRVTGGKYVQLILTPEQRQGDVSDFMVHIVAKSMTGLDPATRSNRILQFCSNVIPQAAATYQIMTQMGKPFNIERYLTCIAKEFQIGDWVEDLFYDPEFEQRLQLIQSMSPPDPGKAKQVNTTQNGGFPVQRTVMSPEQENSQIAQFGANAGQSNFQGNY